MTKTELTGNQERSVILIVDDNPSNIGFVINALERGNHRVLVAQDGEEALEFAKLVCPDLILLEVMIPSIDGFEVCRRLKSEQTTQAIPVIFMTALTGMRDKLAAFEAGAVDYVTKPLQIEEVIARVETQLELGIMRKRLETQNAELAAHRDNLERLVRERTAELHESNLQLRAEIEEHRRAQEELAARECEFRALAEHLPDNLARYDTQGRIIYLNPMLEATLGMTTAEAHGKTPLEAVPGPVYIDYQRHLLETLASGQPSEFELSLPDIGAGVRYHHILIVAERNADGAVIGALTLGRDITTLRRNERELLLLNLAVNASSEAVFLMNEQGRFVYVNEQACSSLDYSREELLTMSPLDIDPDFAPDQLRDLLDSIFANGPSRFPLESHHRTRNGHLFPIEIAASPITLEGKHYCLAMVRDISERKRAEQALAESEQEFRTLAENAPDSIARHDRKCRFVFVNPLFEATRGASSQEILGKTPVEEFPDNQDVAAYQARMARVIETGEPDEFEAVLPDEGEGERFHHIRLIAERDKQDNIVGVLAIGRDITTRKRAEEELFRHREHLEELIRERTAAYQQSEARLRALIDNLPFEFWAMDAELRYTMQNSTSIKNYGSVVGKGLHDLGLPTDIVDHWLELDRRVLAGEIIRSEYEKESDGERRVYESLLAPVEVADSVVGIVGVGIDITERKHYEEALRRTADFQRTLLKGIKDAGMQVMVVENGKAIYVANREYAAEYGYTAEKLAEHPPFIEVIHPDDRAQVIDYYRRRIAGEPAPTTYEFGVIMPDGSRRENEAAVSVIPGTEPVQVIAVTRDITDRKRMEAELAARERELTALAESSPGMMGSLYMRADGSVSMPYVSKNIFDLFGLQPQDVAEDAASLMALTHPDDAERVMESIAESARTMTPWRQEYRIIHPTKGERWMEGNTNPQPHPDGGVIWYGYIHDVTERKRIEVALNESEARYRHNYNVLQGILSSGTEVTFFALDRDYRYLAFNAAHKRDAKLLWGTEIELGGNWLEGVHTANTDEHREFYRRGFDRVLEGDSFSIESVEQVVMKNGRVVLEHFDNFGSPIMDDEGEIIGLTVFSINITERKRLEAELRDSRNFLDQVIDAVPDPVFVKDRQHRWSLLNEAFCQFIQKPREELIGKSDYDFFPKEEADVFWEKDELVFESDTVNLNEESFTAADGKQHFIQTKKTPFVASDGRQMLVGVIRDISERKRAERVLRESLDFTRSVINAIPDILFEVDRGGRYLNIWTHNPELLAVHKEQLLDNTFRDVLAPQAAATAMDALREAEANQLSFGKVLRIDLPKGPRWFELSVSRMADVDSSDLRFIMLSRDVTERILAEEEIRSWNAELEQRVHVRTAQLEAANHDLRESEQRYRLVFESSPVSIWDEDLSSVKSFFDKLKEKGIVELEDYFSTHPEAVMRCADMVRITDVNQAALALHDAANKEALLSRLVDTFTPESFEAFRRELVCLWNGEREMRFDAMVRTLAGVPRYVTVHFAVCPGYENSLEKVLVSLVDITERKYAERELELRNRALDHAFDATYLIDTELNFRYVNEAAARALGYSREELQAMNMLDIAPDITLEEVQELMHETAAKGRFPGTIESQHRRRNGEFFPVEIGATTFNYEGEPLFLTTVRDISERKEAERLLHEQQQALQAAVENSPDTIIRYDHDLRRIYLNRTMQRTFGVPVAKILGTKSKDFSPLDMPEAYTRLISATLETGEEQQAELSYHVRSETRWVDMRFAPEFGADGRVASVLVVGRDITARRAMERENALLRAMADNAVDPLIFTHSLDVEAGLPLQYFNPSFARHLGYSAEEMRGLSVSQFTDYTMEDLAGHMEVLRREKSLRFETEHIRKNGEHAPVEVTLSYLIHNGEEFAAGYCMDISQRKDAERRLQESHTQLQEFAGRLETAREQERKHIARELHDELGQYLTGVRLLISAVDIELGRKDSKLEKKFTQMLGLVDNTKQVLRNLSQKLRPAVLDMGVGPALDWLVNEFKSHSGIACELVLDDYEVPMTDTCATVIFRVVQESLTNVAKHAEASSVSVSLNRKGSRFVVEIRDDGKGFDPSKTQGRTFGLVGMRERLLAVGGKLGIITASGEGTRVIASIPLNIERDNDDKD